MIDTILWFTGLVFWILVFLYILLSNIEYDNEESYLMVKVFRFGFIKVKEDGLKKRLNKFKGTEDLTIFIEAPVWFNKCIYNFGVRND